MNIKNTSIRQKPFFLILLLCVLIPGETKVYSQKVSIQFAPPNGTEFYEFSKIKKTSNYGGEIHNGELEIQSVNNIGKTATGFTWNSKFINIRAYTDDKQEKLPFIATLTNMSILFSLDTMGKILDIQGFNGWDEAIREWVRPELFEVYQSIYGEEAIKKSIRNDNNDFMDFVIGKKFSIGDVWGYTEDFMLPLGATIRLGSTNKFSEIIKFQGKDCLRLETTYNTKIKKFSFDPGAAYQELRKKHHLPPRNINYSDIEITGTETQIFDPSTLLVYYDKLNRKVKVVVDDPLEGKEPISIDTQEETKFDFPDLISQNVTGNTFLD